MEINLEWDEQKQQSNLEKHGISFLAVASAGVNSNDDLLCCFVLVQEF